jgi:hypothetical protein
MTASWLFVSFGLPALVIAAAYAATYMFHRNNPKPTRGSDEFSGEFWEHKAPTETIISQPIASRQTTIP